MRNNNLFLFTAITDPFKNLVSMNDLSGKVVDLHLVIRDDVNPYKFMKKLIKFEHSDSS